MDEPGYYKHTRGFCVVVLHPAVLTDKPGSFAGSAMGAVPSLVR